MVERSASNFDPSWTGALAEGRPLRPERRRRPASAAECVAQKLRLPGLVHGNQERLPLRVVFERGRPAGVPMAAG